MTSRDLVPGEAFPFGAGFWNPVLQAAADFRASQSPQPAGPAGLLPGQHAIEVLVRNESSGTVDRHGVLRISGIAITPTAAEARFRDRPIFIGQAPNGSSTHGIVVTIEPIKQNAIGRAIIVGLAVAKVNVTDAAHKFAKPVNTNTTKFDSDAAEGFPLIYGVHTGTQPSWCAILLGSGPAGGGMNIIVARVQEPVTSTMEEFDATAAAVVLGTGPAVDTPIVVDNLNAGLINESAVGNITGAYRAAGTVGEEVFVFLKGMTIYCLQGTGGRWKVFQGGGAFEDTVEGGPGVFSLLSGLGV